MSIAIGLNDIKKQASFFFKEKIRTARLALTDVTPVQLLTEEATNGNSSAPDAKTMRLISRAAFEIDDYLRIVGILHRRLAKFEKKQWREPYNSLVLLEHLLIHGPERIADEFQSIKDIIQDMRKFQFIDERGFNWGSVVKKKSEKVLKLLGKGPQFREERERARKISHGIQGFGSFNQNSTSNTIFQNHEKASNLYGRSISLYEECGYNEDQKENMNLDLGLDEKLSLSSTKIEEEESSSGFTVGGESEPFIAREEEVKKDDEMEKIIIEHPFASFEKETQKSLLLLSQG
ncbi:epsin-2-like protein [Carex littledalei]|uniref:Epsin-2-like protein n=1 Tax=Carex littledalei TaxID=544730 RepID=A0A833QMU8_9POAL|nr:epsin-2-like protein [Carex littledalei]